MLPVANWIVEAFHTKITNTSYSKL